MAGESPALWLPYCLTISNLPSRQLYLPLQIRFAEIKQGELAPEARAGKQLDKFRAGPPIPGRWPTSPEGHDTLLI
ncbi:hypothetical protein CHS0354_035868 [Potamilus streckersoni]|uniref:Uncharacterized protein n=1 Tax=Potamilus streckersoni TaxID=2493646 RepID=A0AAE0SFI0_9BIVA|nr:hypothetical protein CHS0354_035868 [Potamilus streckersoni]